MSLASYFSRTLFLPLYHQLRGNRAINHWTERWNDILTWDYARAKAWERELLANLLRRAYGETSYYREIIDAAGVAGRLDDPAVLSQLPLLDKPIIRSRIEELTTRAIPKDKLIRSETGGSTSDPMSFYRDRDVYSNRWGLQAAANMALGWDPGEWSALVWGARSDLPSDYGWRYNFLNRLVHRRIILNAGRTDDALVHWFIAQLRKYRPGVIYGYPVMLEVICDAIRQAGIEIPAPRFVIVTAEMLSARARETIEATLRAPIVDRYASREFGVIADQVLGTRYYRVITGSVLMEVIPINPADPTFGELVITDLHNCGLPFIRYRTGDIGRLDERTVNGTPGLYVSELTGRSTDLIVSPAGRVISGTAALPLFREFQAIDQAQIHQLDYDQFKVVIVKGKSYTDETERSIIENLCEYCGAKVNVTVEYVDHIPRDKSGKFRVVISQVAPRLLAEKKSVTPRP